MMNLTKMHSYTQEGMRPYTDNDGYLNGHAESVELGNGYNVGKINPILNVPDA